ncbi:hypothetical protein [Ascidiimonas sp. W6]|uniref:hypothetical protein n=1 Tax=Ascidiimonas meishanensis TaxID=3128903 RepID=UPI0030ED4B5D
MNNQNIHRQLMDQTNLDYNQIRGINDYGLNLEQVQTENFGVHTLRSLGMLLHQRRAENTMDAFKMVQGLDQNQTHAITELGLSRADVFSPNFGEHTTDSMYMLLQQRKVVSRSDAFEMVRGLDQFQTNGITRFGLRRDQVLTSNFGEHTLDGIGHLIDIDQTLTNQSAFRRIQGLDAHQVRGILVFNLTPDQVQSRNFGEHTVNTMLRIMAQGRAQNIPEAFAMVQHLDVNQAWGLDQYRLMRDDVLAPNFGAHTLRGLDQFRLNAIANREVNYSHRVAFQSIRGMNEVQVMGVLNYGLELQHVLNPAFGENTLRTMQAFQRDNAQITNQNLFENVIRLPEYQVRAISQYGFNPAQLGLVVANQSIIQSNHNENSISGRIIDAASHLMAAESMNRRQALREATELNTLQTIGMIDFGLTLEQVQEPFFENAENVLAHLLDEIRNAEDELGFPFLPEEQEVARSIMANMILNASNSEELGQNLKITEQQRLPVLQSGELQHLEELTNAEQHTFLEGEDIQEFLKYALERDVLGIFEGISEAIQLQNLHESEVVQGILDVQEQTSSTVPVTSNVASMPTEAERAIMEAEWESSESELGIDKWNALKTPVKLKSDNDESSIESNETIRRDHLKASAIKNQKDKKPSPKPKRKGRNQ